MKWVFGALTSLAFVGTPAVAEIVNVGFDQADFPTLEAAELEKLDALQTTRLPIILSDISPDQSTLVVATIDRLSQYDWQVKFLNLNTGELEDSLALEYEVFSPTTPIQWVNNDTIRFVQESLFGPWEIVSLNRETGIVSHTNVYPTESESGEILGAAPDLSRFALRVYEEEEDVIYLVSLRSLDRIEVARLPEGMAIQPPSWSADGQRVVFVMSSVEERKLYERTPFSPTLGDPVNQDALGRTPPEENMFLEQNVLKVYDLVKLEPLQLELSALEGEGHL
ncbi:MAG: S9 family peptidase, partial [Cyanobacteria bacterium P01_F01_bin.86]